MSQSPASPDRPHQHVTVSAVHWPSVLEFVHLFRTFRLAVNPAKIFVALVGILLVFVSGWLFDLAWGPQVYRGEIEVYQNPPSERDRRTREDYARDRKNDLLDKLQTALAEAGQPVNAEVLSYGDSPRAAYGKLSSLYQANFHAAIDRARKDRQELERARANAPFATGDTRTPAQIEQADRKAAADKLLARMTAARDTVGRGVFEALLDYEIKQFDGLVENTLTFIRISPVRRTNGDLSATDDHALQGGLVSKDPERLWRSDTVVGCIANMTLTAPAWLFTASGPLQDHPTADASGYVSWTSTIKTLLYKALYLVSLVVVAAFWMLVIAVTGAIICRHSALEFAGSPNANLPTAVRFARGRIRHFIQAPLMPFAIILILGVALAVAGLLGAIPVVGELLLGILFGLLLLGGFLIMLLILGIAGGFNLLYPTMAVEGSDSFDAMSRSFAYVYARPWRLIFYAIISLVYGILTFLFVAFALYLVLAVTHVFVGWGTSLFGYNAGWYSGVPKLETLWPAPRFSRLVTPVNWWAMSWPEYLGAILIHTWVFLIASLLVAFAVSFYHSAFTVIYLLLRRSVDGQSLTDVYEEEGEPATEAIPAPVPAAGPSPSATEPSAANVPAGPPPEPPVTPPA